MLIRELTEPSVSGQEGQAAAQVAGEVADQIAGQPADPASADMIVIEPAHHLTFDQPPEVRGIMFDPDGVTAYVHLFAEYIDAWNVALRFLPWVLAVAGGMIVLAMLRIGYTRIRSGDIAGRFYCRKCGYELGEEDPKSICPECGTDSKYRSAREGQRLRRRLVMPVVMVAVSIAICGTLSVTMVVLHAWYEDLMSWPSARLTEMASNRGWTYFSTYRQGFDEVRRFDLETGAFGGTVCVRPGRTYTRMTISPDGASLYRASTEIGIERIAIESGHVINRFRMPADSSFEMDATAVIGHERDGMDALVFFLDKDKKRNTLVRWNLETNGREVVFEEPAWINEDGRPIARLLFPVSSETGRGFLSAPSFVESYNRGVHEFRLLDASGDVVQSFERSAQARDPLRSFGRGVEYAVLTPPVVRHDGQRMYSLAGLFGNAIATDNLITGETLGIFIGDITHFGVLTLALDDRHLLLADDDVQVYDLKQERWVATLKAPENPIHGHLIAPDAFLSSDGRWFAAVYQGQPTATEMAQGVRFTHDLVIWDVSRFGMGADGTER